MQHLMTVSLNVFKICLELWENPSDIIMAEYWIEICLWVSHLLSNCTLRNLNFIVQKWIRLFLFFVFFRLLSSIALDVILQRCIRCLQRCCISINSSKHSVQSVYIPYTGKTITCRKKHFYLSCFLSVYIHLSTLINIFPLHRISMLSAS